MEMYSEKDMVDVVDEAGNAIAGMPSVPKAWLDTPLVPAGTKKGKAAAADSTPAASSSTRAPRKSGEEPPRAGAGSSTDEWVAFAKEKGASEEDLLNDVGEPFSRDELIAKYGTPAS